MSEVVVDASVLLAAVFGEPGHEKMLESREAAVVSAVNLAETRARLADHGFDREAIDASMALLNVEVVDFDAEQAATSADLRRVAGSAGLSLGDRACLALATVRGVPALTADRAWAAVDLPVDVRLIR